MDVSKEFQPRAQSSQCAFLTPRFLECRSQPCKRMLNIVMMRPSYRVAVATGSKERQTKKIDKMRRK